MRTSKVILFLVLIMSLILAGTVNAGATELEVDETGTAIYLNTSATEYEFPSTVKAIDFHQGCGLTSKFIAPNLEKLVIPSSVTYINPKSFQLKKNFPNLKTIIIDANLEIIDEGMFQLFVSLENIEINGDIDTIGDYSFMQDRNLKSVKMGGDIKTLSMKSFYGLYNLEELTLSDEIVEIGYYSLGGLTKLTSIELPDCLEIIGERAFSGTAITSIDIPSSVKEIGKGAFSSTNITDLVVPANIDTIEENTFRGCKSLETVMIEEGVTRIENYAFNSNEALKTITIPESVTFIDVSSFSYGLDNSYTVVLVKGSYADTFFTRTQYRNLYIEYTDGTSGLVSDLINNDTKTEEVVVPVTETVAKISVVTPTASTVIVNGEEVKFDAYLIGGNNYFKLRDVAYIVNDSEKQFEVGWDSLSSTIKMTKNNRYTSVGGEMNIKGAKASIGYTNEAPIYVDGNLTFFQAYTINDNNYFKLRDLGQVFNIGIFWNGDTKTIEIGTKYDYRSDNVKVASNTEDLTLANNNSKEVVVKVEDNKEVELPSFIFDAVEYKGRTLYPVVTPEEVSLAHEPMTIDELERALLYMAVTGDYVHSFTYDKLSTNDYSVLSNNYGEAFLNVQEKYPEFFSDSGQISFDISLENGYVDYTVVFADNGIFGDQRYEKLNELFSAVDRALMEQIDNNKLSASTDLTMAMTLYRWTAQNLYYDYDYEEISHTAYGALMNGKAVCQGYTSLYNLYCKRMGINISGLIGEATDGSSYEGHMWSVAKFDGEDSYIDVTFGDPIQGESTYVDMSWFSIDESKLRKTHKW